MRQGFPVFPGCKPKLPSCWKQTHASLSSNQEKCARSRTRAAPAPIPGSKVLGPPPVSSPLESGDSLPFPRSHFHVCPVAREFPPLPTTSPTTTSPPPMFWVDVLGFLFLGRPEIRGASLHFRDGEKKSTWASLQRESSGLCMGPLVIRQILGLSPVSGGSGRVAYVGG